jgi:crossover junction endodeoxyribonuclease RuvC
MCAAQSSRKLWTDFLKKRKLPCSKVDRWGEQFPGTCGSCEPFRGKILGIDPSLRGSGLAIIDVKSRDAVDLIFSQTVKIAAKESLSECTYRIFLAIQGAIECYKPKICAMEETIYVQNFQTAQIMGIARGAALTAIASQQLKVFEYAPLRIKQAICGYGRASKEQVAKMVQALLKIHSTVGFDETDAAAASICCFFTERSIGKIT